MNNIQLSSFYTGASCILGALLGLLIALPLVVNMTPGLSQTLFLLFMLCAGGRIGFLRRESRGFLYLMLIGILALACVLSFQGFN